MRMKHMPGIGFSHGNSGEENDNHSSTLAWKILWMEEPGRLQSMGSQRVRHNWALHFHLWEFTSWGKHRACPSTHAQRYSTCCVSVLWILYLSTTPNTHPDFPSAVSCMGNAEGLLLPNNLFCLPFPGQEAWVHWGTRMSFVDVYGIVTTVLEVG